MFHEWGDLYDMDSTFRRLLDQSSRWQIVSIDLSVDFYCLPIKPTRSIQFPKLEVVELACGTDYIAKGSGAYHFIHSLLDNSPKLRRLVLPQVDYLDELSSVTERCNFGRLTSAVIGLDCEDYDTDVVWAILVEALIMLPGLQELSIDIVANPHLEDYYLEDNGFRIPKITSCALKSLSLTLTPSALWIFTQPLIGFLNLNTLTTLEISLTSQQDSVTSMHSLISRLEMMFQKLSNTLQSFKLTCCDILSTEGLLSILSWMPFLQDLSLDADCQVLTSAFFSALTLSKDPETTPHLLPRLTALRLNYTNSHSRDASARLPDPNTVFDTILSRRQRLSGSKIMGGLCQFSLSASARSCSLPDREWAAILRLKFREPELQRGGLSWTCVLDLGEL
ncbi:hypothetical protein VKT23_008486 [Stygiomarasmius scandens]|uniref:Uncharacterized protein n=1 Tax=Marasmiellus scandens TaxID=2682957 RepID=A0ABR1JJV3_9AGAR